MISPARTGTIASSGQAQPRVVLSMPFDGANGSTAFIDNSPSPKAFSVAVGSPTISTAQFNSGNASLASPRQSLITTPDHDDWKFPGNFSIECEVLVTSYSGNEDNTIVVGHYDFPNNQRDWLLGFDGANNTNYLYFLFAQANNFNINSQLSANVTIPLNIWTKVAVFKVGSVSAIAINNVVKNTGTLTYQGGSSAPLSIGGLPNNLGVNYFDGFIDRLLITKG